MVAERIRRILADRAVAGQALLIRRFVPGAGVSLEALLHDGDLQVLALFDKPDPLDGPYFEETIYVTPSRLGGPEQTAVLAAAAEGLSGARPATDQYAELQVGPGADGRSHRLGARGAARSIGGLCSRLLRFRDRDLRSTAHRRARRGSGRRRLRADRRRCRG